MTIGQRILRVSIGVLALFYLSTGVFFYFFPHDAFGLLPAYYGEFNVHFVKDAGLAFSSSGILLLAGILRQRVELPYLYGGSLFVFLHAGFHIQMLVAGMVPDAFIAYEVSQVIAPSLILLLLVVCLRKATQS